MAKRRSETATTKAKLQELRPQKTLIATVQLRAGNCSLSYSRLINCKDKKSICQLQQSPPILPRTTTYVHALARTSPLPLQTPRLTRKDRLPLSIASAHHPTSAHPTLSLIYSFPASLPADASIRNPSSFLQPKQFPKSQSIRKAKACSRSHKLARSLETI